MSFTDLLKRTVAAVKRRVGAQSWCGKVYGGPADCPWNPMLKVAHTCGREKA